MWNTPNRSLTQISVVPSSEDSTISTPEASKPEDGTPCPTLVAPVPTPTPDAAGTAEPFGDEAHAAVKYRTMRWWQGGMVMIAEAISLGILSLPSVLATMGLVPGMVLILLIGLIATYTGFVYGQYKLRYPHIHSMADAGEQMLGSWGREVFGVAQLIFFLFVMASHILTFSIMMNTITMHGSCTIVFGLIGTIICFLFTLPRKLGSVSYMSIASFLSITAAVMVTMIGVGIENPQASEMELFANPSLHNAILATLNIIFAYAGHVAYFGFISELKDPASYPKALILLQGVDTTMYLLVAVITYRYAGPSVASPALGSTGPLLQKISYGIAIPTIVIAGVINGHVAAKYIYVRMFRGTDVMAQNSFKSWGSWVLIGFALWFISWLIAEAVPIFNDLLELISAMLATLCTFSASASFWLYMNRGQYSKNWRKLSLCVVNVLLFLIGLAICGAGLWASGESIKLHSGMPKGAPFSCADNSGGSQH